MLLNVDNLLGIYTGVKSILTFRLQDNFERCNVLKFIEVGRRVIVISGFIDIIK